MKGTRTKIMVKCKSNPNSNEDDESWQSSFCLALFLQQRGVALTSSAPPPSRWSGFPLPERFAEAAQAVKAHVGIGQFLGAIEHALHLATFVAAAQQGLLVLRGPGSVQFLVVFHGLPDCAVAFKATAKPDLPNNICVLERCAGERESASEMKTKKERGGRVSREVSEKKDKQN